MEMLRDSIIAIQSKGRLTQGSLDWLNESIGASFQSSNDPFDASRELVDDETGITVLGYSNDDLRKAVVRAQANFGIIGSDKLYEQPDKLLIVKKLGFAVCRLVLATFGSDPLRTVATSYPVQARAYLDSRGIEGVQVDEYAGGVEMIARRNGYSGVVDVRDTGSSLALNGLITVEVIDETEAVLVRRLRDEDDTIEVIR